jgi:hypothetical protein
MRDKKSNSIIKPGPVLNVNRDPGSDPLEILKVFDRLEVGPVKIEPHRLVAPYRWIYRGKEEGIELVYRYEEDVFDPLESVSRNLAGMIAAQVAVNYGLFCRAIVFHGIFDETDRRFIRAVAENTAREIFVKKFLEPNPFLTGDAAHLPPVKKSRYLAARLKFPGVRSRGEEIQWQSWPTRRQRHAILSSGGKDSLLSYGLIDELKYETHPIFVNESGRHWFTALNAYNHFKKNIPHTGRVWTNADRVFAFALRRMPFIREDFASLRSDEYPIRLWTVAVFLFGALPLLRKREIGRLLIGDEFDTTRRVSYKGISHYDGLYDQRRYFDDALSRYYRDKGWSISQFSILRPLSELLIQKILLRRYPGLQQHQVSCHAAHKESDRVHPCGKCEKCRRIVSLVTALGGDPARCGYTPAQTRYCLDNMPVEGSHIEAADKQHLIYMLMKKGLIRVPNAPGNTVKECPEILKVRFSSGRSPIDGIPLELRKPLYAIYLEYSTGAARGSGRKWGPFDPLTDPGVNRPYAFEISDHDDNYRGGK